MKNLLTLLFVVLFGSLSVSAQTTYGCNDPDAHNYIAGGFTVNSNCKYTGDSCGEGRIYNAGGACIQTVIGCMETTACNYNSSANEQHNCFFEHTVLVGDNANGNGAGCWVCSQTIGAAPHGDGKGVLEDNDINDNGICDEAEIIGCMDATACNFDPDANIEWMFSGSESPCVYLDGACDYCGINNNDGSITIPTDSEGVAYATHPDYWVINGDLDGNGTCDVDDVEGCMNEDACNYNALATVDTSSEDPICVPPGTCGCSGALAVDLPETDCDCDGALLDVIGQCLPESDPLFCEVDADDNGICDDSEITGCMNSNACNFDATANMEGDCHEFDECDNCGGPGFPEGYCNCDSTQADVNGNGLCDSEEVVGCTDGESCTFIATATFHDEAQCDYLDECNVCGGEGSIGPTHCNCYGDSLDALGVCGGKCQADVDGDGICDNVDLCLVPGEQVDACGVCGGPGAIFECGCKPLNASACDCDGTTGVQNYPDPGKNCDGECTNGSDGLGGCVIESVAVVTIQPGVTSRFQVGSSMVVEQNPFELERWMANIDTLHSRMSRNLDDGSLLGSSDSLTIEKQILNKGNLYVNGESVFSGIVRTDSNLSVMGDLFVQGTATIEGTTFANGGLETKELAVAGRLVVGGKTRLDSTLDVTENVFLHDSLTVTNAIVLGRRHGVKMHSDVEGYGWIESDQGYFREDLTAGHNASVAHDFTVGRNVTFGDQLTVRPEGISMKGPFTLTGNQSIAGDLTMTGSADITKHATVGYNLEVGGNTWLKGASFTSEATSFHIGKEATNLEIKHRPNVSSPDSDITYGQVQHYGMVVDGKGAGNSNGIAIRVDQSNPGNGNDFLTFVDKEGYVVGAIEGEQPGQVFSNPDYTSIASDGAAGIASSLIDIGVIKFDLAVTIKAVASSAGKGISEGIPGVGFVDVDVAEPIAEAIKAGVSGGFIGMTTANLTGAYIALGVYTGAAAAGQAFYFNRIGVAYKSGAADYAEWIEKENYREDYLPGEIVGVKSGRLSYGTDHSDHNLVISTSPIVLGNDPGKANEVNFEKVAFMGQVPVRVVGNVKKGDYIIPSGEHDGSGVAVDPDRISFSQIPEIVAVAWEDGTNDVYNIVNASIGLETNGLRNLVDQIDTRLDSLEEGFAQQLDLMFAALDEKDGKSKRTKRFFRNRDKTEFMTGKPHASELQNNNGLEKPAFSSIKEQPQETSHTSLSMEETLVLIESYVNEMNQDGHEVTAQEYELCMEEYGGLLTEGADEFLASLEQGQTLNEAILGLIGVSHVSQPLVEANAKITMAIFDHYMDTSRLQENLRNALKKTPDTRMVAAFLEKYPPGSAAELAFINQIVSDCEKVMYEVSPAASMYCRGRQK
ncbi:MAG: hypothetical protein OSA78_02565 [Flavobacteriales bacterium]|nr:hypothetical protein [Flavobacteriales bacterium]